ncbi:hypothetical protein TNCT_614681 [Trichonephila clavata]|uniref:Uncharacterized protein n=1 Tax=Trichonephila clavata TaxID=2740835 RepID=A0A8X6LKS0_TRICU|nr:hypothetical protein TNCT_614681 [Trichonephila clavata]
MEKRALHSDIKRLSLAVLLELYYRTTPIPREVFDAVEDEQEFENVLPALTACSDREYRTIFAKEASLNETIEVSF